MKGASLLQERFHELGCLLGSGVYNGFGRVPSLNPILPKAQRSKNKPLESLYHEVRLIDILRFFRTVLATNLLKFPFFEVRT